MVEIRITKKHRFRFQHLTGCTRLKGFTVMELMIVIGIMAVLTGIAVFSYLSMRPALRLSGASRQLMSDLMAARMKAVNQNNEFKVFFLNDRQYKILDDDNGDGNEDAGESSETKDIQDHYPGVTLSATADPIFSPRGTANMGTTVTLSNTSGSKLVKVSTTGRIKIE
ncbi:MAG: GspH/FimT family pseudopilin [Deltaproteobacteria bacterium]|nr:GspH/FimT family pseudopilin [Deltaproteobacteria bacterium]MBW1994604.1 GspH/FimT family pseudopilin [Deltaproteobacteria bacterium]MBW2153167.1 GspH/FimT family pseudopilin [Deltaproteobacteria bacterium]